MKKLGIPNKLAEPTEAGLSLLLNISSRLVGLSMLLHCGYRELPDRMNQQKQRLSHSMKKMDKYILLDEQQLSILDKVGEKRHFIFAGSSGSGKTVMQLAVMKRMVDDFQSKGLKSLVIMTSFCAEEDYELLSFFKSETDSLKTKDGVELMIKSWNQLLLFLGVERDDDNTPKTLNDITSNLNKMHESEGYEIILVVDELCASSAPIVSNMIDWSTLSTPANGINLVFAFNPYPKQSLPMEPPTSLLLCFTQTKFRYRSTLKIQRLTTCVGHDVIGFIHNERYATDVEGDLSMWIELFNKEGGETMEKQLIQAMKNVMKMISHDRKARVVLLHEKCLPQNMKEHLQQMTVTRKKEAQDGKSKMQTDFMAVNLTLWFMLEVEILRASQEQD